MFDWFSLLFWMAFLDFKGVHHFFPLCSSIFPWFSSLFYCFHGFSMIFIDLSFVFTFFHGCHRFFRVLHQFLHDFYSLKIHENMIRKLS